VNSTGGIENQYDYLPYGGERDYSVTVTNQNYRFIGKERDSESGLDNFGARYDASSLGRFMTPDWADSPEAIPFAQQINPQSLNLYAYALNSPVTRADVDGHDPGMDHFIDAWNEVGAAAEGASHTGAVTGEGPNCTPRPSAKKKEAQPLSWWQKAVGYFYYKGSSGFGIGGA
jgi:RHS repeat-associated protein